MIFLKKIITFITTIAGGVIGIILLAIINTVFNLGWAFTEVFTYGFLGGLAIGFIASFFVMYLLLRKAKQFVYRKFSGLFSQKMIRRR